jgi:hypothetical protein
MARGWESKSVEAQIELAGQREAKQVTDPAQAELRRQRESLLLSRRRILSEIEDCHNPRYRELLTRSLEHVDQKIEMLGQCETEPVP